MVANDVSQARALLEASPEAPALALVDINLPGEMSGIDLVKEMRQSPKSPEHFAMLTGNPDAAHELGDLADSIPVIAKPFRFAQITGLIEQMLGSER